MLHIESVNGSVEVEASGTPENIVNDAVNAMDGLIKSMSEKHGDEAGTILAAFIVAALAKMWNQSREDFLEVFADTVKHIRVVDGKPPEDSEESAEEYAGVKA